MTEIIKADKQCKKRAYIIIIIAVMVFVFSQSEYFSSDTTGMDANQQLEATQQELIYAMGVIVFYFPFMAFFLYRLLMSAKQTLKDKRYPPINWKGAVDTKVIYGRKAKTQAYIMIFTAIILFAGPIMRGYMVYSAYYLIDDVLKEILESRNFMIESQKKVDKYYEGLIAETPYSIETIEYYLKIRKPDEAIKLMDSLIQKGSNEALFAKASEYLVGNNLPKKVDNSIDTLTTMCEEYVEPCLLLAIHYKEQKQYGLSIKYFRKAESKDFIEVYLETRYLYNSSYMNDRSKLNEYTDKMNNAKSHLCDTTYCLTKH